MLIALYYRRERAGTHKKVKSEDTAPLSIYLGK